jgi:hypothetical protein
MKPVLLVIRDGWGENHNPKHDAFNAVKVANIPVSRGLTKNWPRTEIMAHGLDVGLPVGIMGNSEVGHQNIGAGRIVDQEIVRIDKGLTDPQAMRQIKAFRGIVENVKSTGGAVHLMGLCSEAGVHSTLPHLYAILRLLKEEGLSKVFIHAFMDGRDSPPTSGVGYLKQLEAELAKIGIGKSTGTKLISAGGNINRPGVYEIELGVPVEEFIYSDEYCGGIKNGKKLKACVPGGSSVPILPHFLINKTANGEQRLMTYESLSDGGFVSGSMLGSGGFIVYDEDQCIVRNTWNFARFYRHESCGQCSPCREGTGWMEKVLWRMENGQGKLSDIDMLVDIAKKIEGNTICPLGDAAAWPVAAAVRHFREEFEWHVHEPKACMERNYGLVREPMAV